MYNNIIYEESYEYNYTPETSDLNLHLDYGERQPSVNMKFQHFHPYFEVYYMLSGDAKHITEGHIHQIQAHDIIVLKPFQIHKTNYASENPCRRLILTFDISFFERYFPDAVAAFYKILENDNIVFRFDPSTNDDFIQLFNAMYRCTKRPNSTTNFELTSMFMKFITKLVAASHTNTYEATEDVQQIVNKIYEVAGYIHNNYMENLSLDVLAQKFYISPYYLSRKFKDITSYPLVLYIQETRIKKSQQLLISSDMKIMDILNHCGFGSLSQFNRVFNSIVGMSPSTYRKRYKL